MFYRGGTSKMSQTVAIFKFFLPLVEKFKSEKKYCPNPYVNFYRICLKKVGLVCRRVGARAARAGALSKFYPGT
jgi:hypothetical protein